MKKEIIKESENLRRDDAAGDCEIRKKEKEP